MSTFAQTWHEKGDEKSDTQAFWTSLLRDIVGIQTPEKYIQFEKRVELSHVSYIDGYIPSTGIVIEQKSHDIDLGTPAKQSDGILATPFEQAKRYYDWLPKSERGDYIITCNFREMRIYDMETPKAPPKVIMLEDIERTNLSFLIKHEIELTREERISLEAGELVKKLRDALMKRYTDKNSPETLESLTMLCVRIVFLLYAEDSGILDKREFHDYLASHSTSATTSLRELFKTLDTKKENRDPNNDDERLAHFPYINGGLFSDTNIIIPRLAGDPLNIILHDMSEKFDWSEINPTIFGAVFESTLNPDTRESGGMHYTSIRNIHRVIDPLFMDDLNEEFSRAKSPKQLITLQEKLASLTFLDPACGSGNFLTETYISLRKLENKIIDALTSTQDDFLPEIKVDISQFYGIEINDFAVAVARTALWIAEHQMMKETHTRREFLPLKTEGHITKANAIAIDWSKIIRQENLSCIMGNPPFRGARIMGTDSDQKKDIAETFKGWGNLGNFDYVCCWYKKAADFIRGTDIHAALVSTNSINQGEMISIFWKRLIDDGLHINFAYKPFKWISESKNKANVTCTIVGFSRSPEVKGIYTVKPDGSETLKKAKHINAYLLDAPDWWVFSRIYPITKDIPLIRIGCQLIDNGHYTFTPEDYEEFIKKEPESAKYFHVLLGGKEFLHKKPRYCLYLGNCTPHQIAMMPECRKRVEAVRKFRLASKNAGTRELAGSPTRFHVETFPEGNYIVIPKTSSERREYIPMGFLDSTVMCAESLLVIPNATLYHFGVLMSSVHMAWMRVVCGRMRMDYRYSNTLVYNNFVWPSGGSARIESAARKILDVRDRYRDSSMAELYSDDLMPADLRRAHRENDRAVMEAYGFSDGMSELEIVGRLMDMYNDAVKRGGERDGSSTGETGSKGTVCGRG